MNLGLNDINTVNAALAQVQEELKSIHKPLNEWGEKAIHDLDRSKERFSNWILATTTLSSAIVGVSASALLGKKWLVCPWLLYSGMLILIFNVIFGLFKSKRIIERDIDDVASQFHHIGSIRTEISNSLDDIRSQIIDAVQSGKDSGEKIKEWLSKLRGSIYNKEMGSKKSETKVMRDYTLDWLLGFFTLGIILMILSIGLSMYLHG